MCNMHVISKASIFIFFIIFAALSVALFNFGVKGVLNYNFFMGLGIMFYGLCYFMIHDVLIHQRFKWFKHTNNKDLIGLLKAHKVHHKHVGKQHGECYGMLFGPFKYYNI